MNAIIFDMDGTLIDTERVSQLSWRRAAAELGADVPERIWDAFVGCSMRDAHDLMLAELKDRGLTDAMFARRRELFNEVCEQELTLKPGALETLHALRDAGYTLALATSTEEAHAIPTLEKFGLFDCFDERVYGDHVEHAKPAPDIYLLAAERLGRAPRDCCAVEDSPNGVRSAHGAGMPIFMVPDHTAPTQEIRSMCAGVLETLFELPGALKGLE